MVGWYGWVHVLWYCRNPRFNFPSWWSSLPPCILLPTPLFSYILSLSISLCIDSLHPLSVGLVPPSSCARLTRIGIILKNAQGGTFDSISSEACQTSRNACGQRPSCKYPTGALQCTFPSAPRRFWTQASF